MDFSLNRVLGLLKEGDQQAYAMVFREFYAPLVSFSFRFTRNREASEDIVQGFFCKLWEERTKISREKSFKSYLYMAVRNRSLNYLRELRSVSIEGIPELAEEGLLLAIMEEEVYQELYLAIEQLPERCRQVFTLKLEGKDNREIAGKLAVTEETVRSQLRRGRDLLQQTMSRLFSVLLIHAWINRGRG